MHASSDVSLHDLIKLAVIVIELIAVAILFLGVMYALGRAGLRRVQGLSWEAAFIEARLGLGRALRLGLEVLIAADIILTVALELTLANLAALGVLVLIRTFLSWAIEVETEGHWPWQAAGKRDQERRMVAEEARRVSNGHAPATTPAGTPAPAHGHPRAGAAVR